MGNAAFGAEKRFGAGSSRWMMIGVALGALGVAGWLVRWLMQGEGIVYTDIARPFWVPDATLGWVQTAQRWVWLGLDGLGLVGGVWLGTVTLMVATFRLNRDKRPKLFKVTKVLALAGASVAMLAPILPAWAFVSGFPPAGAVRLLPSAVAVAAQEPGAVAPADVKPLPVTGGRWVVADVPATVVIARITAGGEEFDAKFGPTTGEVTLDPVALANTRARLEVPAASINTGVDMRNGHASGYLEATKHPSIAITLGKIADVRDGPSGYTFAATGELGLMGRPLPVAMTGTLVVLAAAKREELAVTAAEALLVTVSFKLKIADTQLKRENFDADDITLTARLVLVPGAAR